MKFAVLWIALAFIPFADIVSLQEEAHALLKQRVSDQGMVDYQSILNNRDRVDELYQQIGDISLTDASDAEKKAFYINAYNVATIHQVIENYPIASPTDVDGFFDKKKHTVAGEQLTLNELEKTKLLAPYQDPRVHFVLVCAAMSCPPLADFAYEADKLEEQLEEKTRQALNNDAFVQVMSDKKRVELSKIFEWYQGDFTQQSPSLIAYVNQYRDQKIPTDYQIGHYEYDWSLNKQ